MNGHDTVAFWDGRFNKSSIRTDVRPELPNCLDRGLAYFGSVKGRKVLDIGCGLGDNAFALARNGAIVTAIDTSAIAVGKINHFAATSGLPVTGIVHDAMLINNLGSFDFVVGAMILHHLEPFESFRDALHAAMKPGGKAFFYENNAASRLLVWCRQNLTGRFGIPKHGDDEEFPLTPQEVDILKRRFDVRQEFPEMVFFSMVSVYLLRRHGGNLCRRIDDFLFRHNILKSYSYRQILMLQKHP